MLKKYLSALMCISFSMTMVMPPVYAQALTGHDLNYLPKPGSMVALSNAVKPPVLRGIKVNANDPLKFDFILDPGDSVIARNAVTKQSYQEQLKQQTTKLIKYFLTTLTIPDNDIWVNLSPYEKDRIITAKFGQTEMGRDLLAQDYLLKQITASLMFPQGEAGKKFWAKIYAEAQKRFGTTQVPVNTFNKVWIMPEKAVIYEKMGGTQATAFVVESSLKVMLESDYLALQKHRSQPGDMFKQEQQRTCPQAGCQANQALNVKASQGNHFTPNRDTNTLSSQIFREVMVPILEKEVNEGENFAPLRQVYNSILLALWYKEKMQGSILSSAYVNHSKIAGVDLKDKDIAQKIWRRYVQAYKKGVFNFIQEDSMDGVIASPQGEAISKGTTIARKYFSGGFTAAGLRDSMEIKDDSAMSSMDRREFLQMIGVSATGYLLVGCRTRLDDDLESPQVDAGTIPSIPTPLPPLSTRFNFSAINISGDNPDSDPSAWGTYKIYNDFRSPNSLAVALDQRNNMAASGAAGAPYYQIDENGKITVIPIGAGLNPGVSYTADSVFGQKILLTVIGILQDVLFLYPNWQNKTDPESVNQAINTIQDGLPYIVNEHFDLGKGQQEGAFVTIVDGTDLYIMDTYLVNNNTWPFESTIRYKVNLQTGQIDTFHYMNVIVPIILDTTYKTGGLGTYPTQLTQSSPNWQTTMNSIISKYFTQGNFPYGNITLEQTDKLIATGQRLKWLIANPSANGGNPDMAMAAKNMKVRHALAGLLSLSLCGSGGCNRDTGLPVPQEQQADAGLKPTDASPDLIQGFSSWDINIPGDRNTPYVSDWAYHINRDTHGVLTMTIESPFSGNSITYIYNPNAKTVQQGIDTYSVSSPAGISALFEMKQYFQLVALIKPIYADELNGACAEIESALSPIVNIPYAGGMQKGYFITNSDGVLHVITTTSQRSTTDTVYLKNGEVDHAPDLRNVAQALFPAEPSWSSALQDAIKLLQAVLATGQVSADAANQLNWYIATLQGWATMGFSPGDMAMAAKKDHTGVDVRKGGIDLTKNSIPLDVRHEGQAIHFNIDPAQISQINKAPGLYAHVLTIGPLQSLPDFLGMTAQESQQLKP